MPTPEELARQTIDAQLRAAGWVVQSLDELNLSAARGVAVREMQSMGGPADYILFVDGKALGVVEAKKAGTTLSGVAEQSARYTFARSWIPQRWADPLPFTYESTGIETNFRDQRDPDSRSRSVFAFHTPEHLLELVLQPSSLRKKLRHLAFANPLVETGLRDCQIDAITHLEKSLSENRPRALIQMATGSGKTFTAVTQAYRLIKHVGAKRILFLVDRGNLGTAAIDEFKQFKTPDDGRLFSELYNIQKLGPAGIDPVCKVTVSTIQRLYSQLSGNDSFDDEADEHSGYEVAGVTAGKDPLEVRYNPKIPIESFDFVIVDECHRSIYNLWRQVIEYFDAFLIGLTATPSKATLGFSSPNTLTCRPSPMA
jgi:type I restriction enzyme R subunit